LTFGIFYIFLFILDIATAVIMIIYGAWFISIAIVSGTTNTTSSAFNTAASAINTAASAINTAQLSAY
jgi:succinate dehydrogenase hydrophobic anchor subunit